MGRQSDHVAAGGGGGVMTGWHFLAIWAALDAVDAALLHHSIFLTTIAIMMCFFATMHAVWGGR